MRGNWKVELYKLKEIAIFDDYPYPRGKGRVLCYVNVLALFPKAEWKRVKGILEKDGWHFSDSKKVVTYLSYKYMQRTVLLSYTKICPNSQPPIDVQITFTWFGSDILVGVVSFYHIPFQFNNRFEEEVSYAKQLIRKMREEGVPVTVIEEKHNEWREELKRRVLKLLKHADKPMMSREIAEELGIEKKTSAYRTLSDILLELMREGRVKRMITKDYDPCYPFDTTAWITA